ncbi:MAG TPA: hypothetical protein VER55_15310, partial [Ardenticatenaceae bacterium]|nr:hypothetical protein [Ardenticatenaceae bacterium]
MTSWDNLAVVTQVSAQVARQIPTWYGDGAALLGALPDQRARTWSFFMRYGVRLVDGTLTGLLVKIPREPGIATLEGAVAAEHLRPLAQQEYETLLAIAAAFEGSTSDSYCSVRPLAYLPEWNAIVMEELPAEPLKAIILRGRMMLNRDRDWVAVEQALARAGTWLRLFHERVGALKHEPFPAEEYERKIA